MNFVWAGIFLETTFPRRYFLLPLYVMSSMTQAPLSESGQSGYLQGRFSILDFLQSKNFPVLVHYYISNFPSIPLLLSFSHQVRNWSRFVVHRNPGPNRTRMPFPIPGYTLHTPVLAMHHITLCRRKK